jgi:hypothetical protein
VTAQKPVVAAAATTAPAIPFETIPEIVVVGTRAAAAATAVATATLAGLINLGLVSSTASNDTTMDAEEHTKGSRPSTKPRHEKGQARKGRDKGGEKGDDRRDPRGKRPDDHKGPWPPPKVRGDTGASDESDE